MPLPRDRCRTLCIRAAASSRARRTPRKQRAPAATRRPTLQRRARTARSCPQTQTQEQTTKTRRRKKSAETTLCSCGSCFESWPVASSLDPFAQCCFSRWRMAEILSCITTIVCRQSNYTKPLFCLFCWGSHRCVLGIGTS